MKPAASQIVYGTAIKALSGYLLTRLSWLVLYAKSILSSQSVGENLLMTLKIL